LANNFSKILFIIIYLIITSSSLFSQNNYTKEDFAGYWIQTESRFWKNDSDNFINSLGMSLGVYNGLYFRGDSVEFLNGLNSFDLLYSPKDPDRYKNTDFLWNNRYCKFTVYSGHLNIIRRVFNDTSHIKIIKLNPDSLILKRNDYSETFIKKQYAPVYENQFAKITINDDGIGEVIRPSYIIEIFNNRKVKLYTSDSKILETGVYVSKIPVEKFNLIIRMMNLINLEEINGKVYDGVFESTPDKLSINFVNQKEIQVLTNGYKEPAELRWFLRLIYNLYYSLKFTKID